MTFATNIQKVTILCTFKNDFLVHIPLLKLDHLRGQGQVGGQLVQEPLMLSDLCRRVKEGWRKWVYVRKGGGQ